jgi:hypothetical protein
METAEQAVAAARRAFEETARWLGRGSANTVSLLNPSCRARATFSLNPFERKC